VQEQNLGLLDRGLAGYDAWRSCLTRVSGKVARMRSNRYLPAEDFWRTFASKYSFINLN